MSYVETQARRWTVTDTAELYDVASWSQGYFSISEEGHLLVHPDKDSRKAIDLKSMIDRLRTRGIQAPVLFRFGGILRHRLQEIQGAFQRAIDEHKYQGEYRLVYPIKVNQQRQVIEEILRFGAPYRFGLEAGSKPELLAVMALTDDDRPIVCNGFKDAQFIETAMLAHKMGRHIFLVVEKYSDLTQILRISQQVGVRPQIGIRVKLATTGSGRWQASGGHQSKFGLTVGEALRAVEELKTAGMADCLKLLHFHLGSQITNIRFVKAALIEAARIYTDLRTLGAGLEILDVGGGLGVDYDGSQTTFESSVNYTLQEYANDVVFHIQNICDEAGVPHPTIFSESGRAVVAYNSVLVFNVLGVSERGAENIPETISPDVEQPLHDLKGTYDGIHVRNLLESFHDAQEAMERAIQLFNSGYMPLDQRALAENVYWAICRKIRRFMKHLNRVPEELEVLDSLLSEIYYCNFSLFQSLPDSWAIDQLFPIMPIHRLDERPTRQAVLGDITCDSDGKIDQFIERREVRRSLPLHYLGDDPYYLGIFLVGAYQETLGDLHNLFGDTNAVHVSVDEENEPVVEAVVNGDTVREVLSYVEFDCGELMVRLRNSVERAIRCGRLDDWQAGRLLRFYESSLDGYTYLGEDGRL